MKNTLLVLALVPSIFLFVVDASAQDAQERKERVYDQCHHSCLWSTTKANVYNFEVEWIQLCRDICLKVVEGIPDDL